MSKKSCYLISIENIAFDEEKPGKKSGRREVNELQIHEEVTFDHLMDIAECRAFYSKETEEVGVPSHGYRKALHLLLDELEEIVPDKKDRDKLAPYIDCLHMEALKDGIRFAAYQEYKEDEA